MSADIRVSGIDRPHGGLKEALAQTRKHFREVGDALLNVSGIGTADGKPVDKDDARPAYHYQEWPKMIYHADGREEIAATPIDWARFKERGFREEPYIKPQVEVLDPAAEKKVLMTERDQLRAQLNTQNDLLVRMADRLEALEGDKKTAKVK